MTHGTPPRTAWNGLIRRSWLARCTGRQQPGSSELHLQIVLVPAIALLLVCGSALTAQTPQSAKQEQVTAPDAEAASGQKAEAPTTEIKKEEPKKPAYFQSKAFGTRNETEPPGYAKPLSEHGFPGAEELKWLDFGLEHRTRFEHRNDDFRRTVLQEDDQFLLRSRTYLGIHDIVDPFRFGVEFQDCRQFNSDFPETTSDVDENDFLQAFGELYFKDALGEGYPLALRAGRMTLEYTDRHMVGRNRWRNTVNSFDGFRMRLGQPSSDWQVDVFAAQPVERRMRQPNRTDEERWFYGMVGTWRKWHQYITLEPYYFILDEDWKDRTRADREIHTLGLRGFGPIGRTGFDYDFDGAFQVGEAGQLDHKAFAAIGEIGYTFQHDWKPRLSFSTMYASGDRTSDDGLSERFARLFDPGHPYSTADLFTWQNVIAPRMRVEMSPLKKLKFDASYGAYWLASDSDAWVVPNRRDPTGRSGDFVGQELEARVRYQIDPRIEIEIGYSHFMPGGFARETGPCDDSDFLYVATTLRL